MRRTGMKPASHIPPAPIILSCLILASLFFQSCDNNGGILKPGDEIWVATEPVQCLSNAWERDWLDRHGNDYSSYPLDPDSQLAIIRNYYSGFGVKVGAIISVPRYDVVCLACSCPRGDTLYLEVDEEGAETMIGLGYRRESPAWFVTFDR